MKVNQSTGVKKTKSTFSFPCTHITTWDVGQLRPIFIKRLKQDWKFDVNYYMTSRLAPTPQPTFGAFKIKTYAFWIPFMSIWRGYENFVSESKDPSLTGNNPFNFSLYQLFHYLLPTWAGEPPLTLSNEYATGEAWVSPASTDPTKPTGYNSAFQTNGFLDLSKLPSSSASAFKSFVANHDFCLVSVNSSQSKVTYGLNFTRKGRLVFNILRSLGYEIPSVVYFAHDGEQGFQGEEPQNLISWGFSNEQVNYLLTPRYTLYPLLAFARCCFDYVYPSQYVQQQGFGELFSDDWNSMVFDEGFDPKFGKLMDILFTSYDKDFFTTLWQSPNAVANGNADDKLFNVPSGINESVVTDQNNTKVSSLNAGTGGYNGLSAAGLRWMKSLADFAMRNQIGGSRFYEWLHSHFGLVDHEVKTRSRFLKSFNADINFYPVTSAAGTSENTLGEQAGQARSEGSGKLHFTAPCDGYLIVMAMLVPYVGYYQGNKPFTDALTEPEQFYLGEYDGVGFTGVPRSHLYSCYDDLDSFLKVRLQSENNPLGYALRYSDSEKRPYDFLTGDFRFGSRNTGLEGYHTFRNVLYGRNNLAIDANFLSVDNQYNRVFEQTGDVADHVMTMFSFDCRLHANMLSLSEALPIFDQSGKRTDVEFEGNSI